MQIPANKQLKVTVDGQHATYDGIAVTLKRPVGSVKYLPSYHGGTWEYPLEGQYPIIWKVEGREIVFDLEHKPTEVEADLTLLEKERQNRIDETARAVLAASLSLPETSIALTRKESNITHEDICGAAYEWAELLEKTRAKRFAGGEVNQSKTSYREDGSDKLGESNID